MRRGRVSHRASIPPDVYARTISCTGAQEHSGDTGRALDGSARHHRFLASKTLGHSSADPSSPGTAGQVMRGRTILAIADMLLFFFSPSTPLALAGVLLWGVVASIGYCAFLGGPR